VDSTDVLTAPIEREPEPPDPRLVAIPDSHGHAKGEHKPFAEERPIPYTARMLFLWFFHACKRGSPRFMMVADHMNYLTFEDPAAVNLVRRALKLAQAGDLYGAAETAGVEVGHAQTVSEGLRRGMRYSIGAEVDNDPRSRPDAQNIVDAMKPDGMIRSVHFLPITHPTHGENWMWAFDNPEFKELYDVVGTATVWEIYMATLLDAIEKLPGHIVGHFYVPAIFGHWPQDDVLEAYEDKLVDACAERGMAIELNSRYIYKHYRDDDAQLEKFRAVHLRLLRKAVEKNVAIAVGSDAHSPKDQGRGFEAVLALLDEAEINEIAFPIGGRLARVALRATEELMKQHMPPEPEPAPAPPEPAPAAVAEPAAAPVKAKKPRPSRAKVPAVAAEAEPEPQPEPDGIAATNGVAPPADDAAKPVKPAKPAKKPVGKTPEPEEAQPATGVLPIVDAIVNTAKAIVKSIVPKPAPKKAKPAPAKAKPAGKAAAKAAPKKKAAAPVKKAASSKKAASAKKSAPAKKAASKKPATKRKAAPVKPAVKKAAAKNKPIAKKTPPKKGAPAKKAPAKKKAPEKKTAAKKAVGKSAKRPAPKKPPAKKSAKRARR
jgi:HisJ family histidinol phosphate phosphatase